MRIVTDSAADLSHEEARRLGIDEAPLFIQFPGEEVKSTALSPDEFYARLLAMAPEIPTTAQPSPGVFAELYRPLVEAGEDVLSIHISSGLSGTAQAAQLGAEQFPAGKVTVVDSLTLSGGQRFQVLAAAAAAAAGWTTEAILKRLAQIRAQAEVIYTLETLKYLAKGGRIGRVEAVAGMLLNIKPVIRVEHSDGKYSTVAKARSLKDAQAVIVNHLQKMYGSSEPLWATVLHGQLAPKAEELGVALKSALHIVRFETMRISPVLGVHTGPGIVGVAAMPMALMAGLE